MKELLQKIHDIGIIPVIAISDVERAVPLAKALADGGIPCAEITFRTAGAAESIRRIKAALPDILVGAGTVLTPGQAAEAMRAGASFLVSPGFNPRVVSYCVENGIPIIPGCVTPTEMEEALSFGLSTVKFFPAEQAGGLAYIKAVSAPYAGLRFVPTGGISPANLASYLGFERVVACGGSWMATPALIAAGDYARITVLSREATEIARSLT